MSLARNKKGLELRTLMEIFLVIVSAGLIIGVFTTLSAQADEKTSELLCRNFNAIRYGTKIQINDPIGGNKLPSVNVAPRACKTLDKQDVPSGEYTAKTSSPEEAAKAQLGDLIARCWWMWLEGREPNMFDKSWYNFQNGCFVCYTFSLDSKVKPVDMNDFFSTMGAKPYYGIDSSDKCSSSGGKCMADCKGEGTEKETASNKCRINEKCCISSEIQDECVNRGGRCLDNPTGAFTFQFKEWGCKKNSCYVKQENVKTYFDYIKSSGGPGEIIVYDDSKEFKPGTKYAISFVSPGLSWDPKSLISAGGAGIAGAGAVYAVAATGCLVFTGGACAVPILLLTATGGYFAAVSSASGQIEKINHILISPYDKISGKCAIESGVGQK